MYAKSDDEEDSFEKFLEMKQKAEKQQTKQEPNQTEEKEGEHKEEKEEEEKVDPLKAKAEYELKFALETWYDKLKEHTARTEFVELSPEEAKKVYGYCSGHVVNVGEELKKRVNDCIGPGGAFVKLHTRSPKDAVAKCKGAILEEVERRMKPTPVISTREEKKELANGDCNLISTIVREKMKVCSADEAFEMFKGSDRVRSDLDKAVQAKKGSCIVVREFDLCKPEWEFRAFVSHGKLTGLSQYCYRQYFPEVVEKKKEIETLVKEFFQKVKLPFESAVVDVYLSMDNKQKATVKIVEFNPWFADTGALLFSWKSEKDRNILANGPFEFRVLEEIVEDPYESLPYAWRVWFENKRGFRLDKPSPVMERKKVMFFGSKIFHLN